MFDTQTNEAGRFGRKETGSGRFSAIGRWVAARRIWRRRRRLFQSVADLDDRMLADIGLTPFERETALGRDGAPPIGPCGG